MASQLQSHHQDSSASHNNTTIDSSNPDAQSGSPQNQKDGPSAPKDRECPYCHQAFTSSSLGRHLDLYIKEKNPKAPDGIHDVDEIRRLRGKITRRHARTSAAAKAHRLEAQRGASSAGSPSPSIAPMNGVETSAPSSVTRIPEADRQSLYKLNWHATGVMSNLPPRPNAQPTTASDIARYWGAAPASAPSPTLRQQREEKETAKAAEMALKEVIRSVQSAQSRLRQKQLFDFDFFSLNFPALCLQLLPHPSTIFTTTPSPGPDSWPLLPPSRQAFDAANRALEEKRRFPAAHNVDLSPYAQHLHRTFDYWQSLSTDHQREAWQLEIMRALAGANKRCKLAEDSLERATAELEHLRAQIEEVPEIRQYGQWFAQTHPSFLPAGPFPFVSASVANEMADSNHWNFERLMSKWKSTLSDPRAVTYDNASTQLEGATASAPASARHHPNQAQDGSFMSQVIQNFASASPPGSSARDAGHTGDASETGHEPMDTDEGTRGGRHRRS